MYIREGGRWRKRELCEGTQLLSILLKCLNVSHCGAGNGTTLTSNLISKRLQMWHHINNQEPYLGKKK